MVAYKASCPGFAESAQEKNIMQTYVVQRRYVAKADFEFARQKLRDHDLHPAIHIDTVPNGQVQVQFLFGAIQDAEFAEMILGP